MKEDPEQRERTDKIIEAIRREYGFVPVVNQVLSTRPGASTASTSRPSTPSPPVRPETRSWRPCSSGPTWP